MQLYAGLSVRIMYRHADIGAQPADRRAPAQADAGADARLEVGKAGECVAGVDECRDAPVRLEVILVLGAGDDEVLAAEHQPMDVLRADRLVGIDRKSTR